MGKKASLRSSINFGILETGIVLAVHTFTLHRLEIFPEKRYEQISQNVASGIRIWIDYSLECKSFLELKNDLDPSDRSQYDLHEIIRLKGLLANTKQSFQNYERELRDIQKNFPYEERLQQLIEQVEDQQNQMKANLQEIKRLDIQLVLKKIGSAPGKMLDLSNRRVEYAPSSRIDAFNLDEALGKKEIDLENNEHYELFACDGISLLTGAEEGNIKRILGQYRGVQNNAIAFYLKRIFGTLLMKKRDLESSERGKPFQEKRDSYKDFLKRICDNVVDADRNCADQMSGQLETLAILCASQKQELPTPVLAVLFIITYKNLLIKELVREIHPHYAHQADLERYVQREISKNLQMTIPDIQKGQAYNFNDRHEQIEKAFMDRYNPYQFLVDSLAVSSFGCPKLSIRMTEWYNQNFFDLLRDENGDVLAEHQEGFDTMKAAVGCDCESSFVFNAGAVLFYLYNEGVIKHYTEVLGVGE